MNFVTVKWDIINQLYDKLFNQIHIFPHRIEYWRHQYGGMRGAQLRPFLL